MAIATSNWLQPVSLHGNHVRLEPLLAEHAGALSEAVADGELSKLWFTAVPGTDGMEAYIAAALAERDAGSSLPFVVRDAHGVIVGSTRYFNVEAAHRRLEIGHTWHAKRVQRTGLNTEAKLLLLSHAFETLDAIAVEFRTNWFNQRSRTAIARLGAKQDGVLRNHMLMPDGSFRDTVVFSIIAPASGRACGAIWSSNWKTERGRHDRHHRHRRGAWLRRRGADPPGRRASTLRTRIRVLARTWWRARGRSRRRLPRRAALQRAIARGTALARRGCGRAGAAERHGRSQRRRVRCGRCRSGHRRSLCRLSLRCRLALRLAGTDPRAGDAEQAHRQSGLLRDRDAAGDRADARRTRRRGAMLRCFRLQRRRDDAIGQERSRTAARQPDAVRIDRPRARARSRAAARPRHRVHAACRPAFPRADDHREPASVAPVRARRSEIALSRKLRQRATGARARRGAVGQRHPGQAPRRDRWIRAVGGWSAPGRRRDARQPAQGRSDAGSAEPQPLVRIRRICGHSRFHPLSHRERGRGEGSANP